jgi:hypothetical protein
MLNTPGLVGLLVHDSVPHCLRAGLAASFFATATCSFVTELANASLAICSFDHVGWASIALRIVCFWAFQISSGDGLGGVSG